MSSKKIGGEIQIRIGAVHVASIRFMRDGKKKVTLDAGKYSSKIIECVDVSEAFARLHKLLSSPPKENNKLDSYGPLS